MGLGVTPSRYRAQVLVVQVFLLGLPVASVRGGILSADESIGAGFTLSVNFDQDSRGVAIGDDIDILDQYQDLGILFRNRLSLFLSPLGRSPGETDDDEFISAPNALEIDDDGAAFVLFEIPVLAAGAFVLGDDDGRVVLSAYDIDLNLVGTASVNLHDDEERFEFLGFTSDIPIAVIAFGGTDDDDLLIDNLGATPVPLPGTGLLTLVAAGTLYALRRLPVR